jgi:hypothetical protein
MTNNIQQTAVDILCGKLAMKLGIPQAITFYIDHAGRICRHIRCDKDLPRSWFVSKKYEGAWQMSGSFYV